MNRTPLEYAVEGGHCDVVDYLMKQDTQDITQFNDVCNIITLYVIVYVCVYDVCIS